jgi:predicted transposase YbfD/YdcC
VIKVYRADAEVVSDHGRMEERFIEVMSTEKLKSLIDPRWVDLKSIARITYTRTEPTGEIVIDKRLVISSLVPDKPDRILHAARTHWQVENSLHWSLDVTFSEDDCRIRDENAAVNFSWMRKLALGLLKNESSFKASIRRKQRKVCTNIQYLAKVIGPPIQK